MNDSNADIRQLRQRQAQQLTAQGAEQHQSGQLAAALTCYRRALGLDPENADALHLAGVVALQTRDGAAAVRRLTAAALARPGFGEGLNNLGTALLAQGDPAAAAVCLIRAMTLAPGLAEAGNNLVDALKQRAAALEQADQPAMAIRCYRRVLALRPTDLATVNQMVCALNNWGMTLRRQARYDEAADCYAAVLRLAPGVTEARHNLALTRMEQRQFAEVEALLRDALRRRPDIADCYATLGRCRTESGRPAAAIGCYRAALACDPAHAEAMNLLGLSEQRQARLETVVTGWRRASRVAPDNPDILSNLGLGMHDLGRPAAAVACFHRALALDPMHVKAHWNLALAELLAGNYAAGWREYEWRWPMLGAGAGDWPEPLWDGGDLTGRTILLHCEQGLGDSFQFIRYAPLVKAKGATVAVLCPPVLRQIFASAPGVDYLATSRDELPTCDVRAPLLSLPRLFQTDAARIPAQTPYLTAPAVATAHWRARLDGVAGRRVGLVWRGGPAYDNDANRSLPAALLAGLLDVPGLHGVCLQKDAAPADLAAFAGRANFTDLSRELADFTDTAAIIGQLDLLVTVDTSVLHLAGALNAPVWGLLPFVPDWRWLSAGESSRWYPGLRLFRQPARGDWTSVIAAVKAALGA